MMIDGGCMASSLSLLGSSYWHGNIVLVIFVCGKKSGNNFQIQQILIQIQTSIIKINELGLSWTTPEFSAGLVSQN